ncbi:STAS domain-containing protein [Alkalihalophilus pseudofirmus]|uniref:STAS domain-containing protein n=1 Tax=Alkalihalophilus pseudofirmus TaxID=79885 RepID=A0AAJ2KRU3_ALKPS|nr:STAS domain-containing protein [Alkalihalophilus pseudofirmus]MDV2883692.1 STAS domain-containing protein [Alkalihalophilus pseudofirmus]WEG17832.1 STAS domain-containing protein [Alkalihalophilus pseudofirmus]
MSQVKHIILPYFQIDPQYEVLAQSDEAINVFGACENVLLLIDEESKNKFKHHVSPAAKRQELEIVVRTKDLPFVLFDCHIKWEEGVGHLIFIKKLEKIQHLEQLVFDHKKRLSTTNFELLDNKEKVEVTIQDIHQLSAPMIRITHYAGLILFFGDMTQTLIEANECKLLTKAYEKEFEVMLIDFSGIGTLSTEGVTALIKMIQQFEVMGLTVTIIGVKPEHAIYFNTNGYQVEASFQSNLHNVIHRYLHQ